MCRARRGPGPGSATGRGVTCSSAQSPSNERPVGLGPGLPAGRHATTSARCVHGSGGNVTGSSSQTSDTAGKRLELLREVVCFRASRSNTITAILWVPHHFTRRRRGRLAARGALALSMRRIAVLSMPPEDDAEWQPASRRSCRINVLSGPANRLVSSRAPR